MKHEHVSRSMDVYILAVGVGALASAPIVWGGYAISVVENLENSLSIVNFCVILESLYIYMYKVYTIISTK